MIPANHYIVRNVMPAIFHAVGNTANGDLR
jgi:hypothetical protein